MQQQIQSLVADLTATYFVSGFDWVVERPHLNPDVGGELEVLGSEDDDDVFVFFEPAKRGTEYGLETVSCR